MPKGNIRMNKPPPIPMVTPPGKSEKYKGVKHTILVMSGKGGVGKSTFAVNLAVSLAQQGRSVGLIDADINGPDDPKMLGLSKTEVFADDKGIQPVESKYGVRVISMAFLLPAEDTPVIWRGALRHKAIQQFLEDVVWEGTEYVIMDFPPGTGDEALTVGQLIPDADGVVIVITPQEVAILDAVKAINFAKQLKIPVLGVVENMSGFICPHCGESIDIFGKGGGEEAAKKYDVPFLGRIPIYADVVKKSDSGIPVVSDNKTLRDIFLSVAEKITSQVEKPEK